MTLIHITNDTLTLTMTGLDKIWALKSSLEIPLRHIRGIKAYSNNKLAPKGYRIPGTYVPGVIAAGTFRHDGEQVFWNVKHPENAVIIDLTDEKYRQLIVEVADVNSTIATISKHIAAS